MINLSPVNRKRQGRGLAVKLEKSIVGNRDIPVVSLASSHPRMKSNAPPHRLRRKQGVKRVRAVVLKSHGEKFKLVPPTRVTGIK